MIGKLLATPIRLANAPMRAAERIVAPDEGSPERVASQPFESLAKSLEEIDGERRDSFG